MSDTYTRQLALELRYHPASGREDFLQAPCNAEALAWIDQWPNWSGLFLNVHGPAGCGKTHLAHVFAARSHALFITADSLLSDELPDLLQSCRALIVEDLPMPLHERNLFHLFNGAKENGVSLLFTSNLPPARWNIHLPDLRSRMLSVPCVGITPPDDPLIYALLIKLFADRQLSIGQEALVYLIPRIERSFSAIRCLVDDVDRAALETHRTITIPFLRNILNQIASRRE